jgi:Holliday junction resolvasome RuvABC DNA-binding subunit
MITIQLNEHSAEDYQAIQQLRKLGYDEEEIQRLYDEQQEKDRQSKMTGSDSE